MNKKFIIYIFSALFCLSSFGQKTGEIKIPKDSLLEAKTIYDLVSEIPKECKVSGFIFLANIGGALKEFSCSGEEFSKTLKDLLKKFEAGDKFFIEDIRSACGKSHKENYKIIVE